MLGKLGVIVLCSRWIGGRAVKDLDGYPKFIGADDERCAVICSRRIWVDDLGSKSLGNPWRLPKLLCLKAPKECWDKYAPRRIRPLGGSKPNNTQTMGTSKGEKI
jgi:hypothetical protein